MSDADVVREALEHLRSCTYSLVLLLKNVDVELRGEIMRHIDAVPKAHDALDGLVARLAEAERDRNQFRDVLALANERLALLEEALRDTRDSIKALDLKDALGVIEHTLRGMRGGEEQRT